MKSDYVFQLDANGFAEEIECTAERGGCMVVPKELQGFHREALMFLDPAEVAVEPGNTKYCAQSGCLVNRETQNLVFACTGAVIPDGVVSIGESAYCWSQDKTGVPLDPLRLPDSVRRIEYHAFAICSDDPIHIIVPEATEFVGLTAFKMECGRDRRGLCRVTFLGDPEIQIGAFGTKRELESAAEELDWEVLRHFPDCCCTQPDRMLVRAPEGARVHEYCERFGIRHEVIVCAEKRKENAILFGERRVIPFSREVIGMAKQDPAMLNEVYEEISAQLGVEAALQLYLLFRGQQISFPVRFFHPEYVRRRIAEEYDGGNLKELAVKYNYSEKTVRRILHEKKRKKNTSGEKNDAE